MKKQLIQKVQTALLILTVLASSCSKDNSGEQAVAGEGKVSVKIGGVSYSDNTTEPKLKQSTSKSSPTSTLPIQTVVVPFNDELSVQATLSSLSGSNPVGSAGLYASTRAASTPVSLDNGASYQLAAYDASGNYKGTSGVLTYTNGSSDWSVNLPAGAYTFVAVAVAPGKTLPTINFNQKLTNISFQTGDASTDLLWQKQDVQVSSGQNTALNLILSHLFTQVSVSLQSTSATAVGNITGVSGTTVTPNYTSATVKLTDGTYTTNGTSAGKAISFTGSGLNWASSPALIITDGATIGNVHFGTVNLNAGGVAKSGALDLSNLTLAKGVKYSLTLRLIPQGALDIPNSNVFWGAANLNQAGNAVESNQSIIGGLLNATGSQTGCAALAPAGSWHMPNVTDLISPDINKAQGTYNGQAGLFFGVPQNGVAPTTNLDSYIFLPFNSTGAGFKLRADNSEQALANQAKGAYWLDLGNTQGWKPALILRDGLEPVVIGLDGAKGLQQQQTNIGVRCIRSK